MPRDPDDLLTRRQAAAYLKVSIRTLGRWRVEGIGPPSIKLPSGGRRYRQADLDRWLAEHGERPDGPEPGPAG